jgi:hypothetical protein
MFNSMIYKKIDFLIIWGDKMVADQENGPVFGEHDVSRLRLRPSPAPATCAPSAERSGITSAWSLSHPVVWHLYLRSCSCQGPSLRQASCSHGPSLLFIKIWCSPPRWACPRLPFACRSTHPEGRFCKEDGGVMVSRTAVFKCVTTTAPSPKISTTTASGGAVSSLQPPSLASIPAWPSLLRRAVVPFLELKSSWFSRRHCFRLQCPLLLRG